MTGFDRFLHAILMRAGEVARDDRSPTIEAQHLLLAIAAEEEPSTRRVLAGLDHRALREALDREFEHSLSTVGVSPAAYDLPRPSKSLGHPKIGASAKLAMERGFGTVARKKDLRPAHLLLGILRAKVGTVPRALVLAGVDRNDLIDRAREALA
jgi:D-alanyl-D-alanine carboxypeptidase